MKFIAIQTGARHNYAIPSILSNAGLLAEFYTDACSNVGLSKLLSLVPGFLQTPEIKNLKNRQPPNHVLQKTSVFEAPLIRFLLKKKFSSSDELKQRKLIFEFEERFGKAILEKGFGDSTHIISMYGEEGCVYLQKAKDKGLTTITDMNIHPDVFSILRKEQELYPDIESPLPFEFLQLYKARIENVSKVTDIFLSPSLFVEEGLLKHGIDEQKCRLVPYAIDREYFNVENQPQRGSILFVGTANLRKGVHTLGEAATLINDQKYEFRVAGGVTQTVKKHSITKNLRFLGRIPRSEINKEFAKADVFVLPSIAEGSAGAIYEALAVGIPVITTKSAGSVIRDGIDGYIVPETNPIALSERIREIVENRELRRKISEAARERAKDFTWEKYADRFLSAIQQNNLN
ncbi:MAG: glycosyltransferase family 4 protein [Richelia sp. RM2_1_2]|nr:glycosyltransferase family 4 protein [Richelia sp. RM2_1_2]